MDPAELKRLAPLLDEALDIPAAERAGWLAQRTDLPPTLRERLAALFERERDAGAPAVESLASARPVDAPEAAAARHALAAGVQVGPWRLVRELGSGGMGTVWLAERAVPAPGPSPVPQVALKLPHLAWSSAFADRLDRERRILEGLHHPHIARLLEAGVDDLGRPWIALEAVDGEPIDTWCAQRAVPLRQQLELIVQVADAVGFAHGRGIVHRDLKPSNVLVTPDAQVRLLDFGIAKLMHDGLASETALTRDAGRALTLGYASPEQIRGEALGAASDVYSLGVLAYELLAGECPYRLPAPPADPAAALATLEVLPPSRRAREPGRRHALRGDLDAIVMKAMDPDPARRYARGDALADDLRRHLRGELVTARSATPVQRMAHRLRRHRRTAAAAVVVPALAALALAAGATAAALGALACVALLALWQGALARRRAAEAERQAARAGAAQRFLESLFEPMSLGRGDAMTRERLHADDLLQRAADQLAGGEFGGDAQLTADLQGMVGRLMHERALTDRAVELRRARLVGLQRLGAAPLARAQALADLADSLSARGDDAEADARLDAAIALLKGTRGPEAAVALALAEARRAGMRLHRAPDDDATAALERAISGLRRLAPGGPELADALLIQATALSEHQHQADAAYTVAQEAAALFEQHGGRGLEAARLRHRVAALLFVQRRYAEADEEAGRAHETFRRIAGAQHPTTAVVGIARARMLTILGRLDEALPLIRECLPVLEAAAGRIEPAALGEARMAYGEALLEDGRVADALPVLEAAVASLRAAGPPIPRTVGALLLSRAQADAGRFDEALSLLHETLDTRMALWGEEHPSTALVVQRIGAVLVHAGRHDEAAHWLQRVGGTADVREHAFGSVKHRAAATLAQLDMDRGRWDRALPAAEAQREQLLALPAEQRSRPLRIFTEAMWLRARLGSGRHEGLEATFAALMALTAPLYEAAPLRLAVRALRVRWLATTGRADEARAALVELEAAFALQPLGPQYTRLRDEARSAVAPGA